MYIIDGHIMRHVVIGSLMALAVLTSIDLVFAFVRDASKIGQGDYSVSKSLFYVALTAPRRVYEFVPMAAVIGSMMMLGGLAEQREFIAMRSAGISVRQITFAIMKGGMVLVLLALFLGEAVVPFTEPYAQQMRMFSRTQTTALSSTRGIWVRDRLSFVNIINMLPDGELQHLDIYKLDEEHRLRVKTTASKAVFNDDAWMLYGIKQVTFNEGHLDIQYYEKARWDALLNPKLLSVLVVKPEQLPIWRLLAYMNYLQANGLETEPYQFAYWRKVIAPFGILIVLLLSLPFIFGSLRSAGTGQRILIGIMIGIGYLLFSQVVRRMGTVYDFGAFLSNVMPVVLFLMIGLVALRQVR